MKRTNKDVKHKYNNTQAQIPVFLSTKHIIII